MSMPDRPIMCVWDSNKRCDCVLVDSAPFRISALVTAVLYGKGDQLRTELEKYRCHPAEDAAKTTETPVVEQ